LTPTVPEINRGESFASGLLDALVALPHTNKQPNDLDLLLERLVEIVLHFTGFDSGGLFLYLGEDVGLNLGALVCLIEPKPPVCETCPFTEASLPMKAIQTRQAILTTNVHEHQETTPGAPEACYTTRLCLPIFFNDIPQGVLELVHNKKRSLSPYQIIQLKPVEDAIAQIIVAALLELRIQTAKDWLNRLNDFSHRILAAGSYQQALDLTVRYILETTPAHWVSAYLFDKNNTLSHQFTLNNLFQHINDEPLLESDEISRKLLQTDKPVIVSGYRPDDLKELHPRLSEQGIKAYAVFPLKCGTAPPFGVLFACYSASHLFLPDEIQVLCLYAAQAAGAIEHLRLLEESHRREIDLANIVDTVHLLITTLDVDELLKQVTIRIASTMGMDSCAISIYDKDQDCVRMLAQYTALGEVIEEDRDTRFFLDDYPLTRLAMESRQPQLVRVDDPHADPAEVLLLQKMHYNALLMLPLIAGKEPYGLVEMFSNGVDIILLEDDLKHLAVLSEQITFALINAHHYQEAQRARLSSETLRQATAALNSTLELNQVLDLILEQVRRMIDYDSASLMLLEGDCFQIVAVRGYSYDEEAKKARIPLRENELAEILVRTKDWLIIPDVQTDPRYKHYGHAETVHSCLVLPLVSRGEVIGILMVDNRKPDVYTRQDAVIAMAFADQAALAVENARLYESERKNRTLAEAQGEISLALSSSLEVSATLDVLLEQIERVIPFDSGSVLLLEGNRVRTASQRGFERFGAADVMDTVDLDLGQTPNLQYMAYTLCSHCIPDINDFSGWVKTESSKHVKSWVGAPLVAREHLLGFLSLDKTEAGYYTQEHAKRLEVLARHAALALLNAQNYGEVEQASITDYLTGAYNHRYFQQQLRIEYERASRASYPLSLLIVDIDHFKIVNDMYGHLTGDQVLKVITARMKAELRTSDLLARYGGEEFAVILPNTTSEGAKYVGERFKHSVSAFPILVENQSINITMSMGVATFPEQAAEPKELISKADKAMYQAKAHGRNSIYVTESEKGQIDSVNDSAS
jgi:diguanylate cyclase (GGDEF)-like protein